MNDTDLIERLQTLPPDLAGSIGRFDAVGRLVRRRAHRRRAVAATVVGVGAAALALPLVPTAGGDDAEPAAPGPSTTAPSSPVSSPDNPGGLSVVPVAAPARSVHTGSARVDLGPRPPRATGVKYTLRCVDPGQLTLPGGGSTTCIAPGPGTGGVLPLDPGQTSMRFEATDGMRWRVVTTYVATEEVPWGVNAKGETFGAANDSGEPDLLLVIATNGREGYAYTREMNAAGGPPPTSPADALARQEANAGKVFRVPVYESDGETVIGELEIG